MHIYGYAYICIEYILYVLTQLPFFQENNLYSSVTLCCTCPLEVCQPSAIATPTELKHYHSSCLHVNLLRTYVSVCGLHHGGASQPLGNRRQCACIWLHLHLYRIHFVHKYQFVDCTWMRGLANHSEIGATRQAGTRKFPPLLLKSLLAEACSLPRTL